jgi:TRAP-type transport system periplasmic protein
MENRRKTGSILGSGVFGIIILVLALSPNPSLAQAKRVTWNFHTVLGSGAPPLEEGSRWALAEIKKATGGQFEGVIFEKSTLGYAGPDIWEVVGKGLIPFAEMWAPHVVGRYPWTIAFEQPFIYDITKLELTDHLMDKMWDHFAQPLAKDNLILLALTVHPVGRSFEVNKTINPDPKAVLKGMKIRVSGPTTSWATETLGATPVMMDHAEVYEAGMRGMVDGTDSTMAGTYFSMKFHEVFKTVLLTDRENFSSLQIGSTTWMVVANKDFFQGLPEEWQKIIKDTFRKSGPRQNRFYLKDSLEAVLLAGTKYGMKYQTVQPETMSYLKNRAPEYWKIWKKKAGPYGEKIMNEGLEILNAYK